MTRAHLCQGCQIPIVKPKLSMSNPAKTSGKWRKSRRHNPDSNLSRRRVDRDKFGRRGSRLRMYPMAKVASETHTKNQASERGRAHGRSPLKTKGREAPWGSPLAWRGGRPQHDEVTIASCTGRPPARRLRKATPDKTP